MAAQAGAEFHPIPIQQADLADHFADAVWHAETLCFNAHGVAKYLLSRAVRDAGYKVVLTGEGSDEILGGYPHFRRDMLLLQHRRAGPGGGRSGCSTELEAANPVSRGLLLPDGEARAAGQRAARCSASSRPGSRPTPAPAFKLHALLCGGLRARVRASAIAFRALLDGLDVRRAARRPRRR